MVTGGCRSGKSAFSQQLAEKLGKRRIYLATGVVTDDEMAARVARHRAAREGSGWRTIEAPLDPAAAVKTCDDADVVLVDCLTFWVNNLMFQEGRGGTLLDEEAVSQHARELCRAAAESPAAVVFVTNEVGMGIVPAERSVRLFRDLAGRCNTTVAEASDVVVLVVSGIPVVIKGTLDA
ncbi:MAG: bifunctional adenosylcobinamide kinase/adenosylcobinamide-phosphate guanylyltransferase [Planctomycetota bacterium]|nr:MAG: bifunctional adenosylcobinamide kinase/adenosylcobinamide-phosphate guanylyltransferase [Planctomycetota bacterium]